MLSKMFTPNCAATGIGSVPHTDQDAAWKNIIENFPELPFWPQFPLIDRREEMDFQYTESLPGLSVDTGKLILDTDSPEVAREIEEFYRNARSGNPDHFGISDSYGRGLWSMEEKLSSVPGLTGVKGQLIGPVSLGLRATDQTLKPLLYNDILRDVLLTDIGYKARWMELKMRTVSENTLVILDEPYLSFVGSAFTNLKEEDVGRWLERCTERLEGLVGIHCCSNTDWGFLMGLSLDIISFDAYQYGFRLTLYEDELARYLERGGIIAWGLVPTSADLLGTSTADSLADMFESILQDLEDRGIGPSTVLPNSLITPACGLGSTDVSTCERAHAMTRELSAKVRRRYDLFPSGNAR